MAAAVLCLLVQCAVWGTSATQLSRIQHARQAALCALWAFGGLVDALLPQKLWLRYRQARCRRCSGDLGVWEAFPLLQVPGGAGGHERVTVQLPTVWCPPPPALHRVMLITTVRLAAASIPSHRSITVRSHSAAGRKRPPGPSMLLLTAARSPRLLHGSCCAPSQPASHQPLLIHTCPRCRRARPSCCMHPPHLACWERSVTTCELRLAHVSS